MSLGSHCSNQNLSLFSCPSLPVTSHIWLAAKFVWVLLPLECLSNPSPQYHPSTDPYHLLPGHCNSLQDILLASRFSLFKCPFFWPVQNLSPEHFCLPPVLIWSWNSPDWRWSPNAFAYHSKPIHTIIHIFQTHLVAILPLSDSPSSQSPAFQITLPHTPAPPSFFTSSYKAWFRCHLLPLPLSFLGRINCSTFCALSVGFT